MNPEIMIIASGESLDEKRARSVIGSIPEFKVQSISGQTRGIAKGAAKVIKFIGEFIGGSGKVADLLIEQATKELAGASIEIKLGTTVVKVNNINRSQIIELLDRAAQIAHKQTDL